MGFSLVGNSGDTNTSTTNYNYTASQNPQLDFEGAAGGNFGINISPLDQGGNIGEIDPEIYSYYAPVDITSVGSATGDTALAALSSLAQAQAQANGSATQSSGTDTSSLSSLLSGDTLYWILGAVIIFFLAEHH